MGKFFDTNYQAHSGMDNLSGLKKGRDNLSSTIFNKEIIVKRLTTRKSMAPLAP